MHPLRQIEPFKSFLDKPRYRNSTETQRSFASDLGLWKDFLAPKDVLDATQEDCLAWVESRRKKGLSDRTVGRGMACISQAYKFWQYKKLIPLDPTVCFKEEIKLQAPEKKKRGLSKEQREKLLNCLRYKTLQDFRKSLFVLIGIYTGLRKTEIKNLRWSDMDLKAATVSCLRKGNKKSTKILPGPLLEKIKKFRKTFYNDSDYIFYNPTNPDKPIGGSSASDYFDAINKWANFGFRISAHWLRHSLTYWLIDAGVPIEVVKKQLDHNNIQTTMGYYDLADKKLENAIHKVLG